MFLKYFNYCIASFIKSHGMLHFPLHFPEDGSRYIPGIAAMGRIYKKYNY